MNGKQILVAVMTCLLTVSCLPTSKKTITGEFINTSGTSYYKNLQFNERKGCLVREKLFNQVYLTSYKISDDTITIKTDKEDLILIMTNDSTLQGYGYINGTFKRVTNTINRTQEVNISKKKNKQLTPKQAKKNLKNAFDNGKGESTR